MRLILNKHLSDLDVQFFIYKTQCLKLTYMTEINGLLAMVATGEEEKDLNYNYFKQSLFNDNHCCYKRSTFTFLTINSKKSNEHTFYLDRVCDLIGECFLQFDNYEKSNIVCTFEYQNLDDTSWNTIETIHPKTFEFFEKMNPLKFGIKQNMQNTMIPIPFCFTFDSHCYWPILCTSVRFRIKVNLVDHSDCSLVYKAVYLDTAERKQKMEGFEKLYCISSIKEVKMDNLNWITKIDMNSSMLVKDFQIMSNANISKVCLTLNGISHCILDHLMMTSVIPSTYYNVSDSNIYYIPFCHRPSSYQYTASINFGRVDCATLWITSDCKDENNTFILTRFYKMASFQDRSFSFKW